MTFTALNRKSLSLFTAMGGWRTFIEGSASRALFLVAYLLTGQVVASALIAVGGVAVLAVARACTDRKYWSAVVGLFVVGVSALLAGGSGHAIAFYIPTLIMNACAATVFLVSILVRWPVIGLAVGLARGERFGWRRDRVQRRRYQLCNAVFLAKCGIALTALIPLYLAGHLLPLAIAAILLAGTPATGLCVYLCWRVLRAHATPATTASSPP